MNSVPFAFYDAMTCLLDKHSPSHCLKLAGLIGAVVSETAQKIAYEWIKIDHNGRFFRTTYRTLIDNSLIALFDPSYRRCTSFTIRRSIEEPSTDAIVAYQNVPTIRLYFYTSAISNEFVKRIHSLRFVSYLQFGSGSADLIPGMMKNFVPRKTLKHIGFRLEDYVFDEPTETLLLDLIKQEQFWYCHLPAKSNSTVKRIITDWKENSAKFIGKRVSTRMKSDHKPYRAAVQSGNIRECTEDEKRFLKLYYPRVGWKNFQISTNRECGSIYWYCDETDEMGLLLA